MSQAQAVSGVSAVRASDAERDQVAEILRVAYAEGRLTGAELDERIDAAYAAKTRADLRELTGDLPGAISAQQAHLRPVLTDLPVAAPAPGAGTGMNLDRCLLLCLLIAFPPAGVAYWILAARRHCHIGGMRLRCQMAGLRHEAGRRHLVGARGGSMSWSRWRSPTGP